MMTRQSTGKHAIWLKLATLALVVAALGLPINNLPGFGLLAASVLIVFTGSPAGNLARWTAAILLTLLVVGEHVLLSAPRIEEGDNVFLIDGPGSALEKGLPAAAFRHMAERFEAAYPPEKRCQAGLAYCWRPRGIPKHAFALAADGLFDGHEFSRRVTGIDFADPVRLRLGIINDLSLDILGNDGDVQRLYRDRRSLAIFGRWHLRLPYFVMYGFPAAFVGSELCWRGEVLWEGAGEQFEPLINGTTGCRELRSEDIDRRIFGVSIEPHADLAMTLNANWQVKSRRAFDAAATLVGVACTLLLLVTWRPRHAVLPLLLAGLALIIIVLTDVTFIGGYRPFDAGDDGLVFSGFARVMLQALTSGDVMSVLEGAEKVYGFTAGTRYFRMIEYVFFGDSFLGYLLLMLALPFVVYRLCARFIGIDWALAFALLFVATPAGVLFGTSYLHYAAWSARGYGDPLGALIFLAGLAALAGRAAPAFWGALLMALAVIVRPNLVMGAGVLLGGVGLAALWQRQIARAAALCLGFVPVLFTFWHNWYFGGVLVPLSDNVTAANVYMMSPSAYRDALEELLRLDLTGEHVVRAARQVMDLLAGPSGFWALAPLHAAATVVLLRVVCASRFEPMLRLTALAAIALSPIGFIYTVTVRYNLVMWLLTALVVAAWIKVEGLALMDRHMPDTRWRLAAWGTATRIPRLIAWLKAAAELNGPRANAQP